MATPFVNTGTIEVQSGVVSFQGGGTHNGLLSVSAGATVDFNNGPHTFGAANTNNIAGTFQVSGGATVSVNTNVAVTLPNLTLSGGQIGGGGTWTVNGLVNWTGGSIDDLVFNANGVTTISGAAEKSLTRATFNNAVVLTCNGGNIQHNQSVVNNLPGAVFDVQDDMDFNWSSANPPLSTFNNMGIFRKSAGATNETTLLNFFFRNAGLVEVLGGHLGFIGDTQFRQTAGATLLKGGNLAMGGLNQLRFAGGLVGGNGRLIVNSPYSLVVAGQFSPGLSAGRVEVLGNYIQPAAGSYNVEIGGTNAGANYDQVAVSGYADLHGTINVLSVNGFVPALGDRFEIMKFNGYFGSVTFQGLDITNGIRLLPVFSPTNLVLVATNAPLSVSPRMNLARNGDSLWCWWPLGYGTFNVQSATNLNPPIIWSPVSPAEVNRHIFNANEPMQFFRMVQP